MATYIYIIEGVLIFIYRLFSLRWPSIFKILTFVFVFQIALFFINYSLLAFAGLGIMDYWFDFRKIRGKNNNIDHTA